MKARGLSLTSLYERLGQLARQRERLRRQAQIGCLLREVMNTNDIPTWQPWQDLSWQRWIAREGDERADEVVAILEEELLAICASSAETHQKASF